MLMLEAEIKRTGSLSEAVRQQLPFALSLALNQTALDVQLAQRLRNDRVFTIRARSFMERLVKIRRAERARKDQLVVRVRIEGPQDLRGEFTGFDRAGRVLTRHERGGVHTASDPRKPFYIPADATRPSPGTVVPRRLYPTSLGLMDRRGIQGETIAGKRGNVKRIKGADGRSARRSFFVMHAKDGSGRPLGIFEREGKDDIQMVWFFTRRITIRPRLAFFETAEEVMGRRFGPNLHTALERAMRTARPR